jgi:hypothetical protein
MEHIAYQAIVFAQIQTLIITGHDAGGILSTMLQYGQPIVQGLIDSFATHDTYDSTHCSYFLA